MSIKKLLSCFMIFTFLFTSFSIANVKFVSGGIEVLEETTGDVKLTTTVNAAGSEIKGIQARFCNDGLENLTKKITGNLGQMEIGDICVVVVNDSDKNAKVNLIFSDVNASNGKPLCNRSFNSAFGKFLDVANTQVEVPSKSNVIKHFKIQFPIGIDGKQMGCLFYNAEKDSSSEQMVNIVVGKAMFLDYFVGELGDIQNKLELKIVKKEIVNNELIVKVGAKNIGNIDLKTEVYGSLTNMFGINKEFALTGEVVRTSSSLVFSLNFGQLPNYKGLYNINILAKHKVHLDIDINKFDIDPAIFAEKETKISGTYFEMPRIVLGTVLVIIVLLILVLRRGKQKVVYVEKK